MELDETKIPVKKTTRTRILNNAKKNETYDDYINKVIDVYEGAVVNAVR
jgi:hypothetical protein